MAKGKESPRAVPTTDLFDAGAKRLLRRRMMAWFRRNARDLPWRKTRDPYSVWVSEIMLQQTQVVTVVEYYTRFMAAFPTVKELAAAEEDRVLRHWEGLGYYRRARQLHKAAKEIVARYGGVFPRDFEDIIALPGIGRYTAGAIASIAWDDRYPILEANTIRLLSRLMAFRGDTKSSIGQSKLWEFSAQLLPRKNTGLFNQALMELGAEICSPRSPACEICPLRVQCPTRALNLQAEIPAATPKARYESIHEAAVVVVRQGRFLLRRCGENERWAGLWDFPRFRLTRADGQAVQSELRQHVTRLTGVTIDQSQKITTIKHGVTKYRITLQCYRANHVAGRPTGEDLKWVSYGELAGFPLSTTGRKICKLLASDSE